LSASETTGRSARRHPRPSPGGSNTGWAPSPRAGCVSGRWRATSQPSGATSSPASADTASTGSGPNTSTQLYTALLDDGYSPASVLRHHRILSRALTVAVQRGHVPRNVATLVDPPAQRPSDLATALDLDEARAVLKAASVRNSARWTVALVLGLRQSEALALQWKDIDLLANTLTVRRSIHRVRGGGLIYEAPKTRRSQRTLALPLPLVAELHRHKAAQLGKRMLADSEWQDEDLIFAQPNGRPIDRKTDYDDWTRLLQRAGVRHVRLHDGRHTAATLLLSENVHPPSTRMPSVVSCCAGTWSGLCWNSIARNQPTREPRCAPIP
jgi:integrase